MMRRRCPDACRATACPANIGSVGSLSHFTEKGPSTSAAQELGQTGIRCGGTESISLFSSESSSDTMSCARSGSASVRDARSEYCATVNGRNRESLIYDTYKVLEDGPDNSPMPPLHHGERHNGRFAFRLLERELWVVVDPIFVITLDRVIHIETSG